MLASLLFIENLAFVSLLILVVFTIGIMSLIIKWYKKAIHGKALVRTGLGGPKVTFDRGFFVIPILHRLEVMDTTVRAITIERTSVDGLICKDNMRADIKVTFFVRVNRTIEDVITVAQSIGCERSSDTNTLITLFDAKFSEALKTVGKRFNFVDLYNSREEFKQEIIQIIGRDLNGYVLDDCAIDFLEQTPLEALKKDNILDAEGIKKIIQLTAEQQILANGIAREKEKTITKQDVEARETILELQRQLAEKEEKQHREIANIKDREAAETKKVAQQQRLIGEQARIQTEEEIEVTQQNKERQVIIAVRNKERTDAIELEKITRDRDLQINERERIVKLAQIEKERAVEAEKKTIQEVIRERVMVEKTVAIEEERIKDTREYADADRKKRVAITNAEKEAEQALVKKIKEAEASKLAAELLAKQQMIEAESAFASSTKKADALKIMSEAEIQKEAVLGLSEVKVLESKTIAIKKQGEAEASVLETKALAESHAIEAKNSAEAKGITLKAEAQAREIETKQLAEAKGIEAKLLAEAVGNEKVGMAKVLIDKEKGLAEANVIKAKAESDEQKGLAEAHVINQKYLAEAEGIERKADAMKKLDSVGKDHEEFKLRLDKDKQIQLAQINIQKDIASAQASVISEAVKSAKIDIVGGETMFFDRIIGSITQGKAFDRLIDNSQVLSAVKNQLLDGESGGLKDKIRDLIQSFNVSTEDVKNLTISALLMRLASQTHDKTKQSLIEQFFNLAVSKGIDKEPVSSLDL